MKINFSVTQGLAALALTLTFIQTATAQTNWANTGSLNTAREASHGDVAAQWQGAGRGGHGTSGFLTSAEVYDPASGTWTATGSLNTARELSHGDVAAQWQGAGRGGLVQRRLSDQRGAV